MAKTKEKASSKKKKAASGKKLSMRERMAKKKKELAERQSGGDLIYIKSGSTRVRFLAIEEDDMEIITEVNYHYLGKEIGSFISPTTLGLPCAFDEAYQELKDDEDADDEILKMLRPGRKLVGLVAKYEDSKGKKVDERDSPKLVLLATGVGQEIIDLYLDEDEWGDFTDPKNGYDITISREGEGKTDTKYSAKPCKNTKTPNKYSGTYSLRAALEKVIPSYEETKEKLEKILGSDEDEAPKKKKKGSSKKKTSSKKAGKKKRSKDLE